MNTIVVWVLVVTLHGHDKSPVVTVDNIQSQADCHTLGSQIKSKFGGRYADFYCFQARKMKQ